MTFVKSGESGALVEGTWGNTFNTKHGNIGFQVEWDNSILRVENWRDSIVSFQTISLSSLNISSVHFLIRSFNSALIPNGLLVGKLLFNFSDGTTEEEDLIQGENIGEWAFERETSDYLIQHHQPTKIGYRFRTKKDSDKVYTGFSYYIKVPTDISKQLTSIVLQMENNINMGISVDSITIDTGSDVKLFTEQGEIPKLNSLPPASVANRGMLIRIEGSSGVEDTIYVCKKSIDDTYSWVLI